MKYQWPQNNCISGVQKRWSLTTPNLSTRCGLSTRKRHSKETQKMGKNRKFCGVTGRTQFWDGFGLLHHDFSGSLVGPWLWWSQEKKGGIFSSNASPPLSNDWPYLRTNPPVGPQILSPTPTYPKDYPKDNFFWSPTGSWTKILQSELKFGN